MLGEKDGLCRNLMQVFASTEARNHRSTFRLCLILVFVVLANSGCLRRRMTVRTNPPGAQVYVDRQLIGTSPASASFTYYGIRHIEVVADGYRTEKVLRKLNPPWYQLPPLDFISETLWPGEIRDERIIDITMTPDQPLASEELTARANTLRLQAAQGMATGLPPTVIVNPNVTTVQPGAVYPTQPISPTQPAVPNDGPVLPPWRPGQFLRNFFQPGGEPVQRIPETGGSYRPTLGS
jgi:hypothetical protein